MKSLARNLLGNAADAEDAVQETFLKVYRGVRDFKGGAAVSTWAFRILLNTCYDAMRRRRRHPEDAASGDREAGEVLDVPEATSRTLLFSARRRLKHALARVGEPA